MNTKEMLRLMREDAQVAADATALLTMVLANHDGDRGLDYPVVVESAVESQERAAATLLFLASAVAPLLIDLRSQGVDVSRWLERTSATHQASRL